MIAGLEEITGGTFTIDGEVMNDVAPKDREIAMVFQNYALYPHMTVFDNIGYSLKLKKTPKKEIEERVHEAAKILGIEPYLDRKPADLSGGQRQRVAMGRAIVRDAKILLMDEPLSNLDAKLRVQMRAEITKIHKKMGATTIYVTHDQTEAMTLADRIVIIDNGDIQQIGTPNELYNEPTNTFVAGFIGSPAMNLLEVEYHDGTSMNDDGFSVTLPEGIDKQLTNQGYEGKKIIFGIRPEDLHLDPIAIETYVGGDFTTKVEISELLGADVMLYTKIGNSEIVVRSKGSDYVVPGTSIEVAANLSKAHYFDAGTTNRIV